MERGEPGTLWKCLAGGEDTMVINRKREGSDLRQEGKKSLCRPEQVLHGGCGSLEISQTWLEDLEQLGLISGLTFGQEAGLLRCLPVWLIQCLCENVKILEFKASKAGDGCPTPSVQKKKICWHTRFRFYPWFLQEASESCLFSTFFSPKSDWVLAILNLCCGVDRFCRLLSAGLVECWQCHQTRVHSSRGCYVLI